MPRYDIFRAFRSLIWSAVGGQGLLAVVLLGLLSGCGHPEPENKSLQMEAMAKTDSRDAAYWKTQFDTAYAEAGRLRQELQRKTDELEQQAVRLAQAKNETEVAMRELFIVRRERDNAQRGRVRDGSSRAGEQFAPVRPSVTQEAASSPGDSLLTDRAGHTVHAVVLSVEGATVKIRRDDGQEFALALERLSDADQARLREWSAPAEPAKPADTIKLMTGWKANRRAGEEGNVIADLREILGGLADPSEDVTVPARFALFQGVAFLDSIETVKKKMGLSTLAKADCILPGFPNRSFYTFRGTVDIDGYESITFLADSAMQVVAVQLSSSKERPPRRGVSPGARRYLLHDMLNYSMRATYSSKVVWHVASRSSDVVILESDFMAESRTIKFGTPYITMVLKHTTRLYLPKPLIGLVLWNLQTNW